MNELAIELAEVLNISVDKVVDIYPLVREQMAVYRMLSVARSLTFEIGVLIAIVLTAYVTYISLFMQTKEDYFALLNKRKKLVKIGAVIAIALIISNMIIRVITPMLTPDILMLNVLLAN